MTSKFELISIGIVAEDKEENSRYVEIYPIELFPFLEGVIKPEIFSFTREGVSINEEKYSITLYRSMTIKAEWIGSTNRITIPNVKTGEKVKLWTIDGGERYYWDSLGRDDKVRTKERITYAFAARNEEGRNTPLTGENSYQFTIDTINKHITLKTSKAGGEENIYSCQVNTGAGSITIMDDKKNAIQLSSKKNRIMLITSDNAQARLEGKNISLYAPGNYDKLVEGNVLINVNGNWEENIKGNRTTNIDGNVDETIKGNRTDKVDGDVTETIGGKRESNITGDCNITAANYKATITGNYDVTSAMCNVTATSITLKGIIALTGPTTIAGSLSMIPGAGGSGASLTGNMTINGNSTINGTYQVNGNMIVSGGIICSNIVTPTWNGIAQADHLIDT